MLLRRSLLLMVAQLAVALRVAGPPPVSRTGAACRAAAPQMVAMSATTASAPAARIATAPRMQEPAVDYYDEYVETDPVTGEKKTLTLDAKEKLYLECVDAFYNEGGKQLLSNDEYEQLKDDLSFDGSVVSTYSKDEIRFVLANKRYKMGKPILNDEEYDQLRAKLQKAGSLVVLHDGASCSTDTGLCKTDMKVDAGKTRLLYLPGSAGGLLVAMEACFWTLHVDPFLSVLLGAVPAYFFGVWFTENVFAQKPLVVQATCPNCSNLFPLYFGDLFSVRTDGLAGPPTPPSDTLECKCPNCKTELTADREKMIITTVELKVPA